MRHVSSRSPPSHPSADVPLVCWPPLNRKRFCHLSPLSWSELKELPATAGPSICLHGGIAHQEVARPCPDVPSGSPEGGYNPRAECQRWAGETTRQTQFQKNQGHDAEAEEAPCNARRVAGASCYGLSCRAEYAPGRVRRRPLSILMCPRVLFSLTMLVRDDLPELGTDLVAALPSLDVNDLAHCFCRGAKQSAPVSEFATQPSTSPHLCWDFLSLKPV